MNSIPTRKISEVFDGCNAFLMRMPGAHIDVGDKSFMHLQGAHRDDYYIFILVKEGRGKGMIDFREYEFSPGTIYCIMPGQVHQAVDNVEIDCWLLIVDSMLVKDEYKAILREKSLSGVMTKLHRHELDELDAMMTILEKRITGDARQTDRQIISDLISSYIGMIADVCRRNTAAMTGGRKAALTLQFRSLVSENYRTLKRPSHYAALMNLSPVYLNEVVKKTTGMSASECIREEIVLQAKRMLYYTGLTVKDISIELGYEDWTYFTRLFTRSTGVSPTRFRSENLDLSNSNSH